MDAIKKGLEQLIDALDGGGLDHLDHLEYCDFLRTFEQIRNEMSVADHRAINDGTRRQLPSEFGQGSMKTLLTHVLRISGAEAHRRVIAAESLGERWTMTGQPQGPLRPALAEAQRRGEVSVEQAGRG